MEVQIKGNQEESDLAFKMANILYEIKPKDMKIEVIINDDGKNKNQSFSGFRGKEFKQAINS